MACLSASTRDVWPIPLAHNCLPLARTIALLLLCFTILFANTRSSIWAWVGCRLVTLRKSFSVSTFASACWASMPFNAERYLVAGSERSFATSIIRFFLHLRVSRAFSVYSGAMITSKNILFISSATASSIVPLAINTPPNADTGSQARAAVHASAMVAREAMPQALLCFSIAKVGSSKSLIRLTAASMSRRLLYDISLPCSLSNILLKSP